MNVAQIKVFSWFSVCCFISQLPDKNDELKVQLVQNINMERDVRIHMGADAGIQEEPTFDHAE